MKTCRPSFPDVGWNCDGRAFSLVEVVLVIGVVAFVLIPAMGALAMAYRSSSEARKNMEVSMVLQSASTVLGGMPPASLRQTLDGGGLQLHFGEGGQFLGTNSATNAFYRVTATRTPAPGATNHFRQQAALRVAYPPPTFHETKILPVSFFAYGTQF